MSAGKKETKDDETDDDDIFFGNKKQWRNFVNILISFENLQHSFPFPICEELVEMLERLFTVQANDG